MTWPFENDTSAAVKAFAVRSLKVSRKKNSLIVAAVLIITFLLTLVLSAGNIFVSAQRTESLRLIGTTAETTLSNPTEGQKELLRSSTLAKHVGMELYFGTIKDTGSRIGISYIDVAEWEWHRFPLVRNFVGQFPKKENEIMAALWLLEDIGIKEPELGMVVSVTYFDRDNAVHSQEFILSGYFEDNSYIRSGGRGNLYVSPAFAMSADKMSETLYMDLTGSNKENALQQLAAELRLQSGQSLTLSPAYESAGKVSWITIGFLVVIIVLSGYLFIYSFFYFSVSKDVQMYGELITIGATKKQIKRIIYYQIRRLLIRGTLIGGTAGFIGAYAILPYFINIFFDGQINIRFVSVIVGTVVSIALSSLVVYISCNKPVKMLASMQPINTIRYENYSNIKYTKIPGIKSYVLDMAWRNLCRRRKNAIMLIVSFTLGCTAFLAISLFYESIDPKQYVDRYYQYDIEVTDESGEGTTITKNMLTQINGLSGIEKIDVIERQRIFIEYDEDIFQEYLMDFQRKTSLDISSYDRETLSEQFWSYVYSLPEKYAEDDEPGAAYLSEEYAEILPIGTVFSIKVSQVAAYTVHVAGYIDVEDSLPAGGMAPVLYLSDATKNSIGGEDSIFQIGIMCAAGQDNEVLTEIESILPTGGVKIESKAAWEEKLSSNMSIFYIALGGLSIFLLFNSILNFINTMYSSLQERSAEFKTLSNVGMTERQIKAMLRHEGTIYTMIIASLVTLIACVGAKLLFGGISGIAPYAEFHFPIMQLLGIVGLVGIICMGVPGVMYKKMKP
ncbi:ABC transporter permease [Frisingicoccus sp.]|uniref:ABC transporter permease n=1 Tax=Frisingicoccus sp. TaxID=1918627 RepID=UPI003AB1AC7B